MTITQMQYFVAVCEYGTISKSAEIMHISQPSISLAIKDLEEQFGIALFDRENKRFQLSQEGKYMYEVAKDILTQIKALEDQLTDLGKHRNQLCLSVPIHTGKFMLNFFMNDFRKVYPDIHFIIRQYNSPMAFKSLHDGSCDVAIIVDDEKIPLNLEKKPVFNSEFIFCINPNHPLAKEEAINLVNLKNDPVILSEENSYMAKILKTAFYNANSVPNILMYGVQLSLIQDMVSSGLAGTFLIKELADTWPDVVTVPLKQKIPITFSLVWRKDKFLNRETRTLIEHILSVSNQDSANL
jgi:DNA-binding transcriptional LysR family regulator